MTVVSYDHLRLRDRIRPGVRVLFVGINPGVRSAVTGHHFAGYSNRFWKLLYDSRLVPEPITFEDDDRLPEFGYGITNIVARPSPGMDDLKPAEYVDGAKALMAKIRRFTPEITALVGVTVYRALMLALGDREAARRTVPLGFQQPTVPFPTRVFVLPNPSGRNANYSYEEMLAAFRALRRTVRYPVSMRWLVKEEPEHYNFEQFVADGKTVWSGVRNPVAQRNLRAMKKGDRVFFYHTGKEKAVIGTAKVATEAYPDPNDRTGKLVVVELVPDKKLKRPVTLAEIKAAGRFADFALVRIPRLSVMPVTEEQWEAIESMARA
jgi:TDG/mug DNA glycosylase family protein